MKNKRKCDIFIFVVVVILDLSDLFSDWLLYYDVKNVEPGLVYGVPEQGVVTCLLVFSIIGTITFVFEIVNLAVELCSKSGKPWLNVDLVAALTLWLEDIPQITINVVIAWCREDPISIFQTVKASIIIVGIIIRFLISLFRYCNNESRLELKTKTAKARRHVCYRVMIVLGLILNFAGAVAVFVFTQTQRDSDGTWKYPVPETVFEDRYNDDRYFRNVSIYVHHRTFDDKGPLQAGGNWMRVFTINDIRSQPDKELMFRYEFQENSSAISMILSNNVHRLSTRPVECYILTKSDTTLRKEENCQNIISPASKQTMTLKFSFTPPSRTFSFRRLIFGDIKFNAKYTDANGYCEDIPTESLTDKIVSGFANSITVNYYRTHVSEKNHVIVSGETGARFYRQSDLTDITRVWSTGWGRCEPKGSLAPHIDRDIAVPCVS